MRDNAIPYGNTLPEASLQLPRLWTQVDGRALRGLTERVHCPIDKPMMNPGGIIVVVRDERARARNGYYSPFLDDTRSPNGVPDAAEES